MEALDLRLGPAVAEKLRLAFVQLQEVAVRPPDADLGAELAALGERLRARYGVREPNQIPELQAARRLYRSMGMDPTRTRPSSEALLRRVLRGEELYRVNSAVDAGNLFSLELLLPIGLYDAAQIDGAILADTGREGDGYEGIRKDRVNVAGRIALFDRHGPFGNPSSDSLRTCVRAETRGLLLVVFAPADTPLQTMESALGRAEALQLRHGGGEGVARGILPGP